MFVAELLASPIGIKNTYLVGVANVAQISDFSWDLQIVKLNLQ